MQPTQSAKRNSEVTSDSITDASNRLSNMNLVSTYRPIDVPDSTQHRNMPHTSSHTTTDKRHQKRDYRVRNIDNHRSLNIVTPNNNIPPLFPQQPLPSQSFSGYLSTLPNVEDRFGLIIAVLEETSKNFKKTQQRQAAIKAIEGIQERQLGAEFDAELDAAMEKMTEAEHGAKFDAAERAGAQKTRKAMNSLNGMKTHKAHKVERFYKSTMPHRAKKTHKAIMALEHMADAHLDAEMDAEIEDDLNLAEVAESMILMGDRFGADGFEDFSFFAQELESRGSEQMTFTQEYGGGDELMGYDDMDCQQMEFAAEEEVGGHDGYLGNEIEYEMEGIRGL